MVLRLKRCSLSDSRIRPISPRSYVIVARVRILASEWSWKDHRSALRLVIAIVCRSAGAMVVVARAIVRSERAPWSTLMLMTQVRLCPDGTSQHSLTTLASSRPSLAPVGSSPLCRSHDGMISKDQPPDQRPLWERVGVGVIDLIAPPAAIPAHVQVEVSSVLRPCVRRLRPWPHVLASPVRR